MLSLSLPITHHMPNFKNGQRYGDLVHISKSYHPTNSYLLIAPIQITPRQRVRILTIPSDLGQRTRLNRSRWRQILLPPAEPLLLLDKVWQYHVQRTLVQQRFRQTSVAGLGRVRCWIRVTGRSLGRYGGAGGLCTFSASGFLGGANFHYDYAIARHGFTGTTTVASGLVGVTHPTSYCYWMLHLGGQASFCTSIFKLLHYHSRPRFPLNALQVGIHGWLKWMAQ